MTNFLTTVRDILTTFGQSARAKYFEKKHRHFVFLQTRTQVLEIGPRDWNIFQNQDRPGQRIYSLSWSDLFWSGWPTKSWLVLNRRFTAKNMIYISLNPMLVKNDRARDDGIHLHLCLHLHLHLHPELRNVNSFTRNQILNQILPQEICVICNNFGIFKRS